MSPSAVRLRSISFLVALATFGSVATLRIVNEVVESPIAG